MVLNVTNETSALKAVVLGQPGSMGPPPAPEATYDAKSYESVMQGLYPAEENVYREMSAFEKVLLKYGVQVFRPWTLENCNQVFARDVGFVIDDKIIVSNIIPDRRDEQEAYEVVYDQIAYNKIFNLPEKAHVEGGDVILLNDLVLVGVYTGDDYASLKTARTNSYAFHFMKELFPHKTFIPVELQKHDTDPYRSVLHLDCTLMPVGKNKLILYRDGFLKPQDAGIITDIFGSENIFEITREEMYRMYCNVFSISPEVVVSENSFDRLNIHMTDVWGLTVEKVPYTQISRMGGLLRCSTLPLIRTDEP